MKICVLMIGEQEPPGDEREDVMKKICLSAIVVIPIMLVGCKTTEIVSSAGVKGERLPPCPASYDKNTWTDCAGTLTYTNGDKYVGEFKDGSEHGHGTGTYTNGDKYVGEFKDRKYDGHGTYTFADGDKYVHEWKDGKKLERGIYTNPFRNNYSKVNMSGSDGHRWWYKIEPHRENCGACRNIIKLRLRCSGFIGEVFKFEWKGEDIGFTANSGRVLNPRMGSYPATLSNENLEITRGGRCEYAKFAFKFRLDNLVKTARETARRNLVKTARGITRHKPSPKATNSTRTTSTKSEPTSPLTSNIEEKLKALQKLEERGLITKGEAAKRRQTILDSL